MDQRQRPRLFLLIAEPGSSPMPDGPASGFRIVPIEIDIGIDELLAFASKVATETGRPLNLLRIEDRRRLYWWFHHDGVLVAETVTPTKAGVSVIVDAVEDTDSRVH